MEKKLNITHVKHQPCLSRSGDSENSKEESLCRHFRVP